MEFDSNSSSNKKIDHLYNFCVFAMKIIIPTGNLIRNLPIPVPRSGHRIVFYKGNIYAFGGYSPRDPESQEMITNELDNRRLFRELWKFNLATRTWFQLETEGEMPVELASHSAVLFNNRMLVYGGTGLPFGQSSSNSAHMCNLKSLEWYTLYTRGDRPQPLYGQAVALHNNKMYVVGGTTGYDYTICVHCLDLYNNEWSRLDNVQKHLALPSSRYRHEIAILEDKIFVFGGGTVSESFSLNEIPTFNIKEKTWSVSVTTTTTVFPEARRCHGSVQVGSDVFICGGTNGQTIYADIWKINLTQLQWNKLTVELPIPLYFHSVTISPGGQLFSFGGVTDTEGEVRTNALYSVWLVVPSLLNMCWEIILSRIPNIGVMDKKKLFKLGVPLKFLDEEIDFYTPETKNTPEII